VQRERRQIGTQCEKRPQAHGIVGDKTRCGRGNEETDSQKVTQEYAHKSACHKLGL